MYRPRSIIRLILFGFAVVQAPLIAAVVTAIVQVDRLAQDNRAALIEAGIRLQQSKSLEETLTEMQRALGLFAIRDDRDFHATYLRERAKFRNAIDNLTQLNLTPVGHEKLKALGDGEQALYERLHDASGEPSRSLLDDNNSELFDNVWNELRE